MQPVRKIVLFFPFQTNVKQEVPEIGLIVSEDNLTAKWLLFLESPTSSLRVAAARLNVV